MAICVPLALPAIGSSFVTGVLLSSKDRILASAARRAASFDRATRVCFVSLWKPVAPALVEMN